MTAQRSRRGPGLLVLRLIWRLFMLACMAVVFVLSLVWFLATGSRRPRIASPTSAVRAIVPMGAGRRSIAHPALLGGAGVFFALRLVRRTLRLRRRF